MYIDRLIFDVGLNRATLVAETYLPMDLPIDTIHCDELNYMCMLCAGDQ